MKECNGKEISCQHLIDLYEGDTDKSSGHAMLPKLKYEHIRLTSFSEAGGNGHSI